MKKNLALISFLSLFFLLVSCNNAKKEGISSQTNNNNQTIEDDSEDNTYINNGISGLKLHEGTYWDERCLGDNDLNLRNYCEVVISNVTNTSFCFAIYEVDKETENRKVIFLKNTAIFAQDGTSAAFYGKNYTLNFTSPSLTEIRISGFKPLEGNTYLNNKIPGHECS